MPYHQIPISVMMLITRIWWWNSKRKEGLSKHMILNLSWQQRQMINGFPFRQVKFSIKSNLIWWVETITVWNQQDLMKRQRKILESRVTTPSHPSETLYWNRKESSKNRNMNQDHQIVLNREIFVISLIILTIIRQEHKFWAKEEDFASICITARTRWKHKWRWV